MVVLVVTELLQLRQVVLAAAAVLAGIPVTAVVPLTSIPLLATMVAVAVAAQALQPEATGLTRDQQPVGALVF
jgi:predicted aconitase with swiveling domain